jgi:hypothetical protein
VGVTYWEPVFLRWTGPVSDIGIEKTATLELPIRRVLLTTAAEFQ